MIAVIFEATPHPQHKDRYFDIAANLVPLLESVDGFLSVERFESLAQSGKLLSLSFWRDEEAIARWRTLEAHRRAQSLGRSDVFSAYRLRVAHVVRDYGLGDRAEAAVDSQQVHEAT